MYPNLKLEIWKCGVRQNRLAQLIGIHETLLSKIVNGFRMPTPELKGRIASVLGRDEEWLFLEDAGPPRLTNGKGQGETPSRKRSA
jgi:plasmid maintenance system antidote protein VapI